MASNNWDWSGDSYNVATLEQTTPHGVYRAKIERDECPEAPENDGGCPIVQIDTNRGYSFKASMTGYGSGYEDGLGRTAAEILEYFHQRTGYTRDAFDMFERYLRIFHDGTMVETGGDQRSDCYYVAYVTRTLWESWGNVSAPIETAEMTEWEAYLDGDVYGVGVEQATSFDENGEPDVWTETGDGMCWGHYGEEWAKQDGEENLASEIKAVAATMLPLVTA